MLRKMLRFIKKNIKFIKIYKYIYLYKKTRVKFCKDINQNPLTKNFKSAIMRVSVVEIPANHIDNV